MVAAAVVQLAAVFVALTLIPLARRKLTWILVSVALSLMTVRLVLALLPAFTLRHAPWVRATVPGVLALVISAALLAAVLAARRTLISARAQVSQAADDLRRASATEKRDELLFSQGPVVLMRALPAPSREVTFVSANVRQWGLEPEQLAAARVSMDDLIHPDDRARAFAEAKTYLEQGFSWWHQEYRLVCPDGSVRTVADYTIAARATDGAVKHFDCYFIDITDLRQAQATVAREERLFSHGPVVRIRWLPARSVGSISDNV